MCRIFHAAAVPDPTYECVHYQDPSVCAETSLSSVVCPSVRLCTALEQAGNAVLSITPTSIPMRLFATAHPAARAPDWKPTVLDAVSSITCPGHGWSFAVDSRGRIYATHHAAQPRSWTHAFDDEALFDATAQFSCPSAELCVAVEDLGRLLTGR